MEYIRAIDYTGKEDKMIKVFIIGSMTNANYILRLADLMRLTGIYEVRNVKPIDTHLGETLESAIESAYNNIEWCDKLVVIPKRNEDIGQDTLYEVINTRRKNIELIFLK